MAVAQPDFLLIFNENSGTSVTNYGTQSGGYTINGSGSSPTHYQWVPQSLTPTAGYLDLKVAGGGSANLPYMTTAVSAPATAQEAATLAIGFKLDAIDTVLTRSYLVGPPGSGNRAAIQLKAVANGGGFDLQISGQTGSEFGFADVTTGLTSLTYGTFYQLAAVVYFNGSDIELRYKLGSNAVQAPTPVSHGASQLDASWPALNAALREGFSDYGGFDGQIYYFAHDRGGTAWSDTDLADINSDPSAAITGWPVAAVPLLPGYIPPASYMKTR